MARVSEVGLRRAAGRTPGGRAAAPRQVRVAAQARAPLRTAAAAVVYFVNPLDLVPDFLPLLGFVDDAAVIGFVVESLREEMRRYQGFLHQDEPPAEDHENG